jgi:coproporphyrinogen III oxidase-like Fe-S oxidoreductase
MTNIRRQKNFIHELHTGDSVLTSQKDNHKVIYSHYLQHMGTHKTRTCQLNLAQLDRPPRNLQHLDDPFLEDDIRYVIMNAPKEKAPWARWLHWYFLLYLLGYCECNTIILQHEPTRSPLLKSSFCGLDP